MRKLRVGIPFANGENKAQVVNDVSAKLSVAMKGKR